MTSDSRPAAVIAVTAPARQRPTTYPEPFASRMTGRIKRPLGDLFGLVNFGVNLTTLAPGAISTLRHRHSAQDEFVYIVEGEVFLVLDCGETRLTAGMCAGFAAGTTAHHLINRSALPSTYLEIGDRTPNDTATYPDDDLMAIATPQGWRYTHRNGEPYT